jgi:hypothetical protein
MRAIVVFIQGFVNQVKVVYRSLYILLIICVIMGFINTNYWCNIRLVLRFIIGRVNNHNNETQYKKINKYGNSAETNERS